MARSIKNSLLSLMWWKCLGTPAVILIDPCRSVLPGTTTLRENWRVPISDCNQASWSTIFEGIEQLIDSNEFVLGKWASMWMLSNLIPMKSISQEGSIVLEATTWALSDMNTLNQVLKLVKQSNLFRVAIKKSSRTWITCWMPYLFLSTHLRLLVSCCSVWIANECPVSSSHPDEWVSGERLIWDQSWPWKLPSPGTEGYGWHGQPIHMLENGVFRDVVINASTLMGGEVVDSGPFRWVLFGHNAYWMTLKLR